MSANISKRVYGPLLEALRRYCSFHAGKPVQSAWVGLGTESAYRAAIEAGYFAWHDGKQPPARCMGWLVLTEQGQRALLRMLAHGYYVNCHMQGNAPTLAQMNEAIE